VKSLVLALLLCAACSPAKSAYDYGPTLAQTSRLATHNSYWVNRGVTSDLFASGVGEQILDQLLLDHVRSIELDIHPDPAKPKHFLIFHTTPGNDLCTDLASCLAPVIALHDLVPSHSAIIVILELKGITTPTFDADHAPEDLDAELRLQLGSLLYTPADLLQRCQLGATLAACAQDGGWPREGEVAGRVLVAVLGNWNDFPGAQAPADWATYATAKAIDARAAFPMASSWQRDFATLSELNHSLVSSATWDAAWSQSAMLQIEAFDDPLLQSALAGNQIVRADNVFTAADRAQATALGIQLWQTDWPWDAARTDVALLPLPGATTPSALLDVDAAVRVPLPTAGEQETHAWFATQQGDARLYAAMAVGLAEGVTPCLAASAAGQPDVTGVSWCKHKIAAHHGKPGQDAPADPNGERVTYIWQACHAGACSSQLLEPQAEAIALDVKCGNGQCCATPQWLGRDKGVTAVTLAGAASDGCFAADAFTPGLMVRWDATVPHPFPSPVFVGGVASPIP
jgi:hypothetical protein